MESEDDRTDTVSEFESLLSKIDTNKRRLSIASPSVRPSKTQRVSDDRMIASVKRVEMCESSSDIDDRSDEEMCDLNLYVNEEKDERMIRPSFVFEEIWYDIPFTIKSSTAIRDTRAADRAKYERLFRGMDFEYVYETLNQTIDGDVLAPYLRNWATLERRVNDRLVLRAKREASGRSNKKRFRIVQSAAEASVLDRVCLPPMINRSLAFLESQGLTEQDVEFSATMLESLLLSQLEGQPIVCRRIAEAIYVHATERIKRVSTVISEFRKKRKLGDKYVPPKETPSIDDKPLITTIHVAGTSGCGKTKVAESIAKILGASEEAQNLIKIPLGNMADSTHTQNLVGAGKGLAGYGEKQSLPHKLKNALRRHDPSKCYDAVEHLAYANEDLLSFMRLEESIADTLHSVQDKKGFLTPLSDLYATPKGKSTKKIPSEGLDFLNDNTDMFVHGKYDVKIGAPIEIPAASYFERCKRSKLPVLSTDTELFDSFTKYYSRSQKKDHWYVKTELENEQYGRSPDDEDEDEEKEKTSARAAALASNRSGFNKSDVAVVKSELEKAAPGSMFVPKIGDYVHLAYPSVIVVILDELDKAHKDVLKYLMDFLVKGTMSSTSDEMFVPPYTTHIVVLLTSNFGASEIERLYNDRIFSDLSAGIKTDDEALRAECYDAMRSKVEYAMTLKGYDACAIVRLGQIVPYAPISAQVTKNVCLKFLTTEHRQIQRQHPLFNALDLLPHNGYFNTEEKAKHVLFLSQSLTTCVSSMFYFATTLLGFSPIGPCAKSVFLTQPNTIALSKQLGDAMNSYVTSNKFSSNLGVLLKKTSLESDVELMISFCKSFYECVVSALDQVASYDGEINRKNTMTSYQWFIGRINLAILNKDTTEQDAALSSALSVVQSLYKIVCDVLGDKNTTIQYSKLRSGYVMSLHRWYQRAMQNSMFAIRSNIYMACSASVNKMRLKQLAHSEALRTHGRNSVKSVDGERATISTDTGLRGMRDTIVTSIVKPSDTIIRDPKIRFKGEPTRVRELNDIKLLSTTFVFSEADECEYEYDGFMPNTNDPLDHPFTYTQYVYATSLNTLLSLTPETSCVL